MKIQIIINYSIINFCQIKYRFLNLNIFKISKFDEKAYKADKEKLLAFYRASGYRDAKIVYDEVTFDEDGEATIVWTGTHQEYDSVFKGNKNTIKKWLRANEYIN